ncbi:thiosulfate/3-mercaptopyruvate sulfurtransferase [Microbacterium marinum]|uniref:thiosulfate sulfurtransferase n=1 Tax=Microbacterium marinum TaxID=421115 RepID=A0A7W7BNK6_9MICO|nr:thiosulfate/3-mercaptopyruvate sulfurtransferase [Microbacterium marinum]
MGHLISVDDIDVARASGRTVRLLDVRWRLDVPEGRPAYVAGHLPGAVYVDLERELASPGHPELGRHPLPSLDELRTAVQRWGVNGGDLVVAYDDNDGVAAARAWWLLRRRGVDIRVLDGGLRAWIAAGLPLQTGDVAVEPGDAVIGDDDPGVISLPDVARLPQHGVLVDVRSPDQYRGRAATLDPIGGHIPGAVNVPAVTHMRPDGRLRAPSEIASALAAHGIRPGVTVAVYCGSAVASTHSALAFELAGVDAKIYTGSWSQWSRTSGRPVATGADPWDVTDSA